MGFYAYLTDGIMILYVLWYYINFEIQCICSSSNILNTMSIHIFKKFLSQIAKAKLNAHQKSVYSVLAFHRFKFLLIHFFVWKV